MIKEIHMKRKETDVLTGRGGQCGPPHFPAGSIGRATRIGLSARRVQWWIRLNAQRFAQQVLDRFIDPCQGKWL
jgi:hypothetical protein